MKIAIVGTGISGLTAAYLLNRAHDIEVFETADYVGGHTNTELVNDHGKPLPVDTGFIVCNPVTYPGFMRLMDELGVALQSSNMSFSVSDEETHLEWASAGLNGFFAQRRNLLNPSFWNFISDFFRFRKEALAIIDDPAHEKTTLGGFLKQYHYSKTFGHHFLVPATSAIWSSPMQGAYDFPAQYLFGFYKNHGLFTPHLVKWRTVTGGSKSYVEKITAGYKDYLHLNLGVRCVERHPDGVTLTLTDGSQRQFDQVVIATHSDQALALLSDPSKEETQILGAIPYQPNDVILHTDESLMPKNKRAWASWNYKVYNTGEQDQPVSLTYWMNSLQALPTDVNYCVTVNPHRPIDPAKVLKRFVYHHPQYTFASIAAQKRRAEINGSRRTFFCGAYWAHGFHEDGLQSGVSVAAQLGVQW